MPQPSSFDSVVIHRVVTLGWLEILELFGQKAGSGLWRQSICTSVPSFVALFLGEALNLPALVAACMAGRRLLTRCPGRAL